MSSNVVTTNLLRLLGLLAGLCMAGATLAADTLLVNQSMALNQFLASTDARYRFTFQTDGNLVVRRMSDSTALWASATNGKGGTRLTLQSDGNLVLYTSSNAALWSSGTNGINVTRLVMQNDGNLVLYTNTNAAVWSTGTVESVVDASTLNRKVMAGYQGWFTTSGDSSGRGWRHWSNNVTPNASNITFDMWPDLREYAASELTATGFSYRNGTNAGLYSAYTPATVARHVKWMRDYGIDGVFVQRFIGEAIAIRGMRDRVLANVRAGSETHGRVFANMYDISGGNATTLIDDIKSDWMHLVDNQTITASSRYLRHNGKPVVAIWGFGVVDASNPRPGTAAELKALVRWFNTDAAARYRATVVLGVDPNWRTHSSAWRDAYDDAAVISPWTVGRYTSDAGADSWRNDKIAPDLSALQNSGVAYMPVIWPGFSWYNLQDSSNAPLNQIPRRGGRFFWRQAYNATAAGATMMYVAMYDEVDEGTAMFKIAENANQVPSTGRFVTLDIDGETVPSDRYLRLMGEASRMLRGERPVSATMP
jgi:hypothetical protein